SPSALLRVTTSSISVSLSAATFSRTTSNTGAPLSSATTSAPATPARSSMMSWRKPRRRVREFTRPTLASGFSTASSVTRNVPATDNLLTSCFRKAYSSCVTLERRHSRSQVGADWDASAEKFNIPTASSNPRIVLVFIVTFLNCGREFVSSCGLVYAVSTTHETQYQNLRRDK